MKLLTKPDPAFGYMYPRSTLREADAAIYKITPVWESELKAKLRWALWPLVLMRNACFHDRLPGETTR